MIRAVIDETQFRRLVAGQAVTLSGVEIILSDIGWNRMLRAILDGMAPPDPPEAKEFLPQRRRKR